MVGMENIEVRSKDYILRWIHVSAGNTISWSIQPHRRSLNFGIVKRPEAASTSDTFNPSSTSTITIKQDDSIAVQTLEAKGYKFVQWTGKLDADKVHVGTFDVSDGEAGNYALVFDNTFSKNAAKSATIVLMTYQTNAPPTSGHHLHFLQQSSASNSATNVASKPTPTIGPKTSLESLPHETHSIASVAVDPRPRSRHAQETMSEGGKFYTGHMLKKRRKHNNYAKRFFSLDFTTGTLSYYQNRNSSALRGAIPLALAVITTTEKRREISVDSGAEIWHLRLKNGQDYSGWRNALDKATKDTLSSPTVSKMTPSKPPEIVSSAFIRDWERIEVLVSKLSGIRDAVRRLAKDTDPKYLPQAASGGRTPGVSPNRSPSDGGSGDYFSQKDDEDPTTIADKRPFWRRNFSGNQKTLSSIRPARSKSAQRVSTSPNLAPLNTRVPSFSGMQYLTAPPDLSDLYNISGMHDHCMAILADLDNTVADFSTLVADSRRKREISRQLSRKSSIKSVSDDEEEFFDANDGAARSQLLEIPHEDAGDSDSFYDAGSDTSEDLDTSNLRASVRLSSPKAKEDSLFPSVPQSLSPLPLEAIQRRHQVAPPKLPPPSLLAFLRKNVGKDFANIAMPASANEPMSGLQRVAETLEYANLLEEATKNSDPAMRLLYVAAFAVSSFSSNRVKERAIRKPFNPMLGETFELVREDLGFRALSEKISHRPVRLAIQADAKNWTFLQAAAPTQKFWGKSAELNTEGRVRIVLRPVINGKKQEEVYSYALATSFLRNIIAGEKYIEPVANMTILCESTGGKAIISFKAGGMFAGRSEEVVVQAFSSETGASEDRGLSGKWTSQLSVTLRGSDTGEVLWRVNALPDAVNKHYGFTEFAAQMNEVTAVEQGRIAKTDSRLRPDQRALEDGLMDEAEAMKAKLEERQRGRRRVMEDHDEEWKPRWFTMSGADGGGEEVWRLKTGKDGYWEQRDKREWSGLVDVFEM